MTYISYVLQTILPEESLSLYLKGSRKRQHPTTASQQQKSTKTMASLATLPSELQQRIIALALSSPMIDSYLYQHYRFRPRPEPLPYQPLDSSAVRDAKHHLQPGFQHAASLLRDLHPRVAGNVVAIVKRHLAVLHDAEDRNRARVAQAMAYECEGETTEEVVEMLAQLGRKPGDKVPFLSAKLGTLVNEAAEELLRTIDRAETWLLGDGLFAEFWADMFARFGLA